MGAWTSRRNQGVEEVDISTNNAYRYPPKSGCYFGSHFIMGGDRFETTQPEAYLFGDNQDLNFMGNRPVPFPYPAPQAHEPTKTLKSLVNIRKDSLRFIKIGEDDASSSGSGDRTSVPDPLDLPLPESPPAERAVNDDNPRRLSETSSNQDTQAVNKSAPPSPSPKTTPPAQTEPDPTKYNIEFTFDSDVKCAITIMYFATEEISNKQAIYRPRDAAMNSETFHFKRGANQVFCQTSHILEPGKFSEEEWQYNPDKEMIPIVIQCVVEEEEYVGHSHMTFASVEKVDNGYALKPLKQKQMVDGLCYLLQEIYGIENKNNDTPKLDDDFEENGSECVICLVEMRDTLILPCRHLCLCNCCADNLRYQASNCPICRSPFRALLQIRAMRKKMIPITSQNASPDPAGDSPSQEGIPPGYEAVALIDALNGPSTPSTNPNRGSRRNFPDARGRSGSQPTSPEESPLVGRRRLRRKASTGSTRSRQSVRSVTLDATRDTSEPPPTERDQQNTPEVIMSDITDVSKSPKPKKFNMPKIKYPTAKSALNEPYYAVIAESAANEPATDDYEDIKVDIVDETAAEATVTGEMTENMAARVPTPPADYDVLERYPKDAANADVYFKPGAHTMVLCDPDPIDDPELPTDPVSEGDGLPPHIIDPLFQTANPEGPDASGSSYSSTDSTKGLLYQQDTEKGSQDLDPDNPPLV